MARKKQEIALQKELSTQEEWDEVMGKEGLFIIDVYQDWCGPCKSVVSLFRRLKNESGEDLLQFAVAKADTIDSLVRYRGTCKPCFLFYGTGTLVEVVRGVNPPELEKQIKSHLTNELNVLKGEPGAERKEIRDPAFKEIDEAERRAKEKADEEEEEELEREVTVVLIKPDAKDKVEDIKQKFEERGIEILEQQERQLTEEEARDFYRHLEDQEWFEQMISYMTTDTSTVLVIAKDNAGIISEFREILGPANVEEAKETQPESLRAIFGSESFKNAIHAADSGEKAQRELQLFFPEFRIPTYRVAKPKKEKKPEIEKTVALIRPDAFAEFKDEILAKINEAGFVVALQKEVQLTREQAEEFYSEKKENPFFEELITRMTNGPVLALALAKEDAVKEWRERLGEKDPKEAKTSNPQSLRAMYSKEDIEINLLHGSDSMESAKKEIEFFFPTEQTLVVIKPDAYDNKDEIIQKIAEADFIIAARKEQMLSEEMARELYKSQAEKEYFEELIAQMTSGKSVFLVLSRYDAINGWRAMMGETDPAKATDDHPDSIRAIFGKDLQQNAVHGSSNQEHAAETIRLIFGDIEFDSEGRHVPGTGDVPEPEPEPEEEEEFRGPNGELVRTDAEEAAGDQEGNVEGGEHEEEEAREGQEGEEGQEVKPSDEAAQGEGEASPEAQPAAEEQKESGDAGGESGEASQGEAAQGDEAQPAASEGQTEAAKEDGEAAKPDDSGTEDAQGAKEDAKEDGKEDGKEDAKEGEAAGKEDDKEETKEDTKDDAKEDAKNEAKEDAKEDANDEAKEDAKEDAKDEAKEDAKEDAKDGANESAKEDAKDEAKEDAKDDTKQEPKDDGGKEDGKDESKDAKDDGKAEQAGGAQESSGGAAGAQG